jgi:hypothetical protein
MNKRILVSVLLMQAIPFAPTIAHADSSACEDRVITAAIQDAQGIASDEDVRDECTADVHVKSTTENSYGFEVTCGDALGFTYDVTVIRDKGDCQVDDVSQIALE